MKKRNLISFLLAAVMAATCLAGCGQDEVVSTNQKEETSTVSTSETIVEEKSLWNVGELPIVNEPVTLKVLTQDPTGHTYDTADKAGIWTWLEEKTGVHFEVESYSAQELKNKLPLIMATPSEMPDLFIRCDFTAADIQGYGQAGQLLMLDEYIEEYGTNIKEIFNTVDYAIGATYSPDGHVYALPAFNGTAGGVAYYYNERFLLNSGINEWPDTMEELYDVLTIMKTKDANGDGIVGNEVLWSGTVSNVKRAALSMVGINCYWPWQGCLFDEKDDNVFFVPTHENYKYMLEMLAKFYKEGLLDSELFTQATADKNAKFASDLMFLYENLDNPYIASYKGMTGWRVPKPLTSAVNDEPFWVSAAPYQTDIGAVSAYTEYPEICMLVLDYMLSEECSFTSYQGIEGVDYIVTADGRIDRINPDYSTMNGPTTILLPRNILPEWKTANNPIDEEIADVRAEYGKLAFQNYLKFTAEENDVISEISADLGLYCDDFFVGVVTGEYDLAKEWDNYVAECEKMRSKELTDIYQASYNRYYGLD